MPHFTPDDVNRITDFESMLGFLNNKLDWPVDSSKTIEDVTFDYAADELRIPEASAERLHGGIVRQLRDIRPDQKIGIFFVEFDDTRVYATSLRQILRGLVPNRRQSGQRRTWTHENLLFICSTKDYEQFTFAHFSGEKHTTAKLSLFGWERGDTHLRTLCDFNLPSLIWPDDPSNDEAWLRKWSSAFDVEKVTDRFFDSYREVFEAVESEVKGSIPDSETTRLYTQRLFNRLMFIYFIQKKGWLTFMGDRKYLRALFSDAQEKNENFLSDRLHWLFFYGMGNEGLISNPQQREFLESKRGVVPYLNGGLFDVEDDYDAKLSTEELLQVADVTISNGAFGRMLDLFERYNFTVEESTPFDIQVAVDPEMLGKVFEELVTEREARQASGRYYTPRAVVSFMCRESLKKCLDVDETLVDNRSADDISVPEARELLQKLDNLTVIDPACGSGAYLLGMLHEIHALMRLLDTRAEQETARDDYLRKLRIIENNLYGVDKDYFAVQIARFRLWLSLVIEYDDSAGIRELPTLPNLDFKVECGDSLTSPNPEKVKTGSFKAELIRNYREAKDVFITAHGSEKRELDKRIHDLRDQIRQDVAFWLYGNETFTGFDWAIEFAEVFDQGGFDIVLANPPYGASVGDAVRNLYFDRRTEGAQSKDTYGLFIARGLQLLRDGGQLCFIVSDTWRTIKTHKPLRRRLAEKTTVWHVLDLPSWIFNATVNTGILTVTKRAATDEHQLIAGDLRGIGRGDWDTLTKNLLAVAAHGVDVQTLTYARYTYPQSLIPTYDNASFFIASPQLYKLMSDPRFTRLNAIAEIKQGLITADNRFYLRKRGSVRGSYEVLDENELLNDAEIAALTDNEKLNGTDPKKHGGKHFLPYDKGGESEAGEGWMPNYHVPTGYFIDWSRTSVKRLLTQTSDRQAGRIAARFQNREYYFREGVTFSPTGIYSPTFRLGCSAIFGNKGSTIFFDDKDPIVFLGILTSKVARYLLKSYLSHTVETGEEVLLNLVLPELSPDTENAIRKLVSAIIEKQRLDPRYPYHMHEQREIDALVYQLYGLTDDDVREIELWYCRRYSRLAEAQGVMREIQEKYADHLARCERIIAKPPAYWRSNPILSLIARDEGPKLEFKETLEADTTNGSRHPGVLVSALKTMAAFLNTEGGRLLIGVSDSSEIRGLDLDYKLCNQPNEDGLEQKLRSLINSRFDPSPLGLVKVSFEPLPEGTVCVVDVSPSSQIVHFDKRDVYVRDGNVTRKLEGPALTQWVSKRASS